MTFIQFLMRSTIAGLAIPLLLTTAWWLMNITSIHNLSFEAVLERITLMLWPSSFALLVGAGAGSSWFGWKLLIVATAINVVVYSVLGGLLWYGLKSSRVVLLIPIVLIGIFWIWALFFR